jgi:hypothetical protein
MTASDRCWRPRTTSGSPPLWPQSCWLTNVVACMMSAAWPFGEHPPWCACGADPQQRTCADKSRGGDESFRNYVEQNPLYEPFAGSFAIHHGRLDIFHRTPATNIAVHWLWDDLEELGILKGIAPQRI